VKQLDEERNNEIEELRKSASKASTLKRDLQYKLDTLSENVDELKQEP